MAFQELTYPCVHLALDRLQLHHRTSASSPLLTVRALWHPAACLEPSVAPACAAKGSTTRRHLLTSACCILLKNSYRSSGLTKCGRRARSPTMPAHRTGNSTCNTHRGCHNTLEHGAALWLCLFWNLAARSIERNHHSWVTPSTQGDNFTPSSGPSSCDTWSDNSEPPEHVAQKVSGGDAIGQY